MSLCACGHSELLHSRQGCTLRSNCGCRIFRPGVFEACSGIVRDDLAVRRAARVTPPHDSTDGRVIPFPRGAA